MKTYELVIEQKQPTCGGRAPTKSEIQTVTTDDPVAYVRELEPNGKLEVENIAGGLAVTIDRNGLWIRYEFTED
ncbi:MAG: hypothetical protein E7442_07635 [Ruminococcaceae bacterium]|nr:hypothetical protein [Oscillospiraceae bacterium]